VLVTNPDMIVVVLGNNVYERMCCFLMENHLQQNRTDESGCTVLTYSQQTFGSFAMRRTDGSTRATTSSDIDIATPIKD
jgi:hypothetical protein